MFDLQHSESDWLQILAETGILGMMTVILIIVTFFYQTILQWKQCQVRWAVAMVAGGCGALVSIMAHGMMDFNLHIPSNALLANIIAALMYVTAHMSKIQRPKKR